jgi:RimJ/RimL family protein N-acetyltransferase
MTRPSAIWGPTARDSEGCVKIGHSLASSARGKGIGTAAVAAFVRRLTAAPGIRRLTAVTGAQNSASRRLLERQGFHLTARFQVPTRSATHGP